MHRVTFFKLCYKYIYMDTDKKISLAPRVVTTILSGEDIEKFDFILGYYSASIAPSISSVVRLLVRTEYERLNGKK